MKEVKQRNVPEMDSPEYLAKKKHFERMITVYGKNAVSDLLHVHREWTIERIMLTVITDRKPFEKSCRRHRSETFKSKK